jgi:hypothetical protein
MNTDQKNVLKKLFGTTLICASSLLLAGCAVTERRTVLEKIIRTKQTSGYTARHIRYESCIAKMVQLDLYKAADIELLCNQAHGKRE